MKSLCIFSSSLSLRNERQEPKLTVQNAFHVGLKQVLLFQCYANKDFTVKVSLPSCLFQHVQPMSLLDASHLPF